MSGDIAGHTIGDGIEEAGEFGLLTFCDKFHSAIGEVLDVASDVESVCDINAVIAKTNPLNAASV